MNNAAIIAQLCKLGPLPDGSSARANAFPFLEFDALIQQLAEPLAPNHSLALINLGPPVDTCALKVEWALVHAAESISPFALHQVLVQADDTEVKRIIALRLANAEK